MSNLFLGVDIGADCLHFVALKEHLKVHEAAVVSAAEIGDLVEWAASATVIAIDAPARLSTAPHHDDRSLSPKFARARCARSRSAASSGSGSPGVTPMADPVPGWMATGLAAYEKLRGPARSFWTRCLGSSQPPRRRGWTNALRTYI